MEWLKNLKELLNQQCVDTEQYRPLLLTMEDFWKQAKTQYHYVPQNSGIELFEPTDVRLKNAEEKLQKVKNNPACGIRELMQQVERNLNNWISHNQFGYLMTFEISQSGLAKAVVSGMLSPHASYGTKTQEEEFVEAIEKLQVEGFELYYDRSYHDYFFLDNDNNRQRLNKKFAPLNIYHLEIKSADIGKTTQRVIREYSFLVNLSDLLLLPTKIVEERTTLNADDFRKLSQSVSEFASTYQTIQMLPDLTNTCLSVMECIFADLCKMLKVDTETAREYEARHTEERAKNVKIREIETEIASAANFADFAQIVSDRLAPVNSILEKHNFYMDCFSLDCYGRATLVIRKNCLGRNRFEGFETFAAFGRNDELEVLDTENNKEKLEQIIPFFELSGMELMVKDSRRCIKTITYVCKHFF